MNNLGSRIDCENIPKKNEDAMTEFICIIALGFAAMESDALLARTTIVERDADVSVGATRSAAKSRMWQPEPGVCTHSTWNICAPTLLRGCTFSYDIVCAIELVGGLQCQSSRRVAGLAWSPSTTSACES